MISNNKIIWVSNNIPRKSWKVHTTYELNILTQHSEFRQWAIANCVGALIWIQVAQRSVSGLVHCLMVQHIVAMTAGQ